MCPLGYVDISEGFHEYVIVLSSVSVSSATFFFYSHSLFALLSTCLSPVL